MVGSSAAAMMLRAGEIHENLQARKRKDRARSDSGDAAASCATVRWGPQGGLGAEALHHGLVGLDVGSTDQIDAVRNHRENAVHQHLAIRVPNSFQCLANRLGLTG